MTPKIPGLTKSKVVTGIQCEKALYLTVHASELAPSVSPAQQAIFDQGHEVGLEAQKRFPGGVLIDVPRWELSKALTLTQEAIANGAKTIYEATFAHEGVLVRVDILHRQSVKKPWQLIEVKSATSVKEAYLTDIAIQTWVLKGAGIELDLSLLMYLNPDCVAPDLNELFRLKSCTAEIAPLLEKIPAQVKALQMAMAAPKAPDADIGRHCTDPYECAFKERCWKEKKIPEMSVLDLPGSSEKKWALYAKGIFDLADSRIQLDDYQGSQRQMLEAARTGKRTIQKDGLADYLSTLRYPLYYLDFETVAPAIPRFSGTRPYQQIPFQFSVHVQAEPGAMLERLGHLEYLHGDRSDPRFDLADALVKAIGPEGSIVSYSKGFEEACMKHLADVFLEFQNELLSICERLEDPLPMFRKYVYDPGFLGSFSIKAVAPALLGEALSYEGMEVGEGGAAVRAFMEMTSEKTSPERQSQLREALLRYCKQDTLAMVELVEWVRRQV